MTIRRITRDIAINVAAQAIWVVMVAGSLAVLLVLFGTTNLREIAGSSVQVPTILVFLATLVAMTAGVLMFFFTRRASAVRGRVLATKGNLDLLQSRQKVRSSERVIRSTRFSSWPPAEALEQRSAFRAELDQAILTEGADVRRIWNLSSIDDVNRLREMLERYRGKTNHSIRAYFDLPYHALPELLIVDGRGASMSFPSMRTPRGLDWMMRFKRQDLTLVVRDYFDVLWDRADRLLDSGELTESCDQVLRQAEGRLSESGRSERGLPA